MLKLSEADQKLKDLERELKALNLERMRQLMEKLFIEKVTPKDGLEVLVQSLSAKDFPKAQLQGVLEFCSDRYPKGVVVLTHVEDGMLSILTAAGVEARKRYKAGDLVKVLSEVAEGKGGGRADRAQAGSKHVDKEPLVLARAKEVLGV
jgi:alanyl-tRNA synthetase